MFKISCIVKIFYQKYVNVLNLTKIFFVQIKDYKTIAAFEDFTVKIYDGKLGYKDLLKLTGEMPKNIEHIEVVYNNTDFGDFYEYSKKQVAKMFGSEFEQGSPIVNFLKNGNEIEIQNAIGTLKNGEQVYYSKDKLEWCMGYEKGGELDDREETYKKWKSLVNMSKSELENFYNSGEGKKAGLSSSEAKNLGIHSGRESARWIMKMKDTPKSEWTPTMWKWAKRQISFISRMSGNKGGLYDDKGNKTRKHTSLLIWGHNPKKHKSGGTISQTPAPKKDKVYGSKVNVEGSSKDTKSAKEIKFDAKTLLSINNKVKEHNKQHPDKKVTLATAKAVVRRGMGAYSSTHRPTISGGKPNSRVAWGLARLNAFMYKIVHGKSKSGKYSQDDDLINELGYKVKSYANGGEVSDIKSFNDWFVNWYKNGVCKKMNIIISVPNKLTNLLKADEDNAMILDLFEKTDQSIDEKKYMDEMLDKADQYGVILYAKHNPSYQMFGFEQTPDNYIKRLPNLYEYGGDVKKLIQLPDVQASEEALARVLEMQGYKLERENYSKGGIFKSYKKIEQIAKEKNISLSYAKIKLRKGMKVESEHSNDKKVQEIIALQHLDEDIKYYDKK